MPTELADWFAARGQRDAAPVEPVEFSGEATAYAQAALASEAGAVLEAPEGQRNDRLNRAAFALGTLVAAGEIDEDGVADVLAAAAQEAGLDPTEIRKTIRSGLNSGKQHPRDRGNKWDSGSVSSASGGVTTGTGISATNAATSPASSSAPTAARSDREVVVTWADKIPPERALWGWVDHDGHGRIPMGSLSIAAGRESTGKSSFGMWLAAHVSKGELRGEWWGQPHRVLYAAVEDSWGFTLVPRLIAAGADLSRVGRVDVKQSRLDALHAISLPSDFTALERTIRATGAKLLILDPLLSMIDGSIDTHRNRDTRTVLDPLVALAERTGVMILGIAHFNKSTSGDAAQLITGSAAFKDVPRAVFGFARDADGRVMTQVKNSLGMDGPDLPSLDYKLVNTPVDLDDGGRPVDMAAFKFVGRSARTVEQVLATSGGSLSDREERGEAADWLYDHLVGKGGEAQANDIYKAGRVDGYSQDVLKSAKTKLKIKSEKRGFGASGYWVWALNTTEA